MQRVEINQLSYPAVMALYDGDKLIGKRDIDCHVQAFSEVLDSTGTDIFEKQRLMRAIHLFEPEKITIKGK